MDCYLMHGSNDFKVPAEQYGLDVISPSTNDWFHWGLSEFVNDGFSRKYSSTSAKENLTNLYSDTRASPLKESKVPQVTLAKRSSSSSASDDSFMPDSSMRTPDDFFHDLLDFEMQSSMQKMDDIFLNSFLEQDLIHLENPCELSDTTGSTHLPWNLRMTILEGLVTMTDDSKRMEDSDPNFRESSPVELNPTTEISAAAVEIEPVCMEATVLLELENVMLQMNSKTRICIRDALYRLANRSKEQHNINLCQTGTVMDWLSHSEICCGNSRQELSRSLEPETNVIDRAIATLMFDRPENPDDDILKHL